MWPVVVTALVGVLVAEDVVINIHNGGSAGGSGGSDGCPAHGVYPVAKKEGHSLVASLFAGMGEWVQKTPLPAPRADFPVVASGSDIYLIGGTDANKSPLASILKYDTHLETYDSSLAAMPTSRGRMGAAIGGGVIYVVGGCGGSSTACGNNVDAVSTMVAYTISTNTWDTIANIDVQRLDVAVVFLGGKVYVLGGYSTTFSVFNELLEIDPVAGTTTTKAAMANSRGDAAAVVWKNKIAVVGGWTDENQWSAPLAAFEVWDPRENKWETQAPLKWPRGDAAMGVLRGRLLVVGGERIHPGTQATEIAVHHVEEYDAENDMWIEMAPLPDAKFRMTGVVVEDVFYTFGGQGRGAVPTAVTHAYVSIERPHLFVLKRDS